MHNRTNKTGQGGSWWLTIMALLLLVPFASLGATSTVTGKVIHIVDGDTFDVLDEAHEIRRIRVSCMDTPEKGQPFYRRAKDALAGLIHGRQVTVESYKVDRYRRLIGEVVGIDLCLKMIETGMAWHNLPYARELTPGRAALLADAEQGANPGVMGYGPAHPLNHLGNCAGISGKVTVRPSSERVHPWIFVTPKLVCPQPNANSS